MLQKNPNDRPTAHQALAHKWILKYMTDAEKDDILKMEKELVSAQENMKKFQEEYFVINAYYYYSIFYFFIFSSFFLFHIYIHLFMLY